MECGIRKINYYTYMAKAGGETVNSMLQAFLFRRYSIETPQRAVWSYSAAAKAAAILSQPSSPPENGGFGSI